MRESRSILLLHEGNIDLFKGLDFCTFDLKIESGVSTTIRCIQAVFLN